MIQQKSRITLILLKMQCEDRIRWPLTITKDMIMKVGVLKINSFRSSVSRYIVTENEYFTPIQQSSQIPKREKKCSNPTIGGFVNKTTDHGMVY